MVLLQALQTDLIVGNQPCEIVPTSEGWFIRTTDGESVGPFSALREVEDWLDARDQYSTKPTLPAE